MSALSQYTTSVATYFGKPIGVCLVTLYRRALFIQKLAVRKQYRRRGVASTLFEVMRDFGETLDIDELVCDVPETLAYEVHPWFTKHGFRAQELQRRRKHEDRIRFTRLV
jgi:N-acetylglutamate synthase-like GNAT family acetyltransferase